VSHHLATRSVRAVIAAASGVLLGGVMLAALTRWERRADAAAHATLPSTSRHVMLPDGRRLQLDCRGQGATTVLFESGAGADGALEWSAIQDSLAGEVRACAYSRAGLLWSDPDPRAMTPATVVQDLHALLERAGEDCPCIFVAHSIGGLLAVHYTRAFPADVAGLVLVDITHPDEIAGVATIVPGMVITPSSLALAATDAVRWTGVPRLLDTWRAPVAESPAQAARRALSPAHRHGQRREYAAIDTLARLAPTERDLGNRPLVVLAAGVSPRAMLGHLDATPAQFDALDSLWRVLQVDVSRWSRHTRFEVVANADHNVHHARPDRVVAAIREVVADVGYGGRMAAR
jgi:pimeloyl-ACP methyl ester carboxylesterase